MSVSKLPVLSSDGGLSRYLSEIRKFPMLTQEEEYTLGTKWREEEDREAADRAENLWPEGPLRDLLHVVDEGFVVVEIHAGRRIGGGGGLAEGRSGGRSGGGARPRRRGSVWCVRSAGSSQRRGVALRAIAREGRRR